ncbi:hypothetical protein [Nitratifractor salsuginis]|uniref:Uncharacterized protein n=1 Tax=Nitratifractor salsuginis (strain DSM 16511 / JCM 12458 / E9I37-1) TaxID=749222 RepID=E6X3F8_NITSE|nr:hypothetical protein [Nitratifractor salsuginis]ADV46235.1 hypothetical protein Nitsa_0976 [Nitratifractor salsuginis DSM 16511]
MVNRERVRELTERLRETEKELYRELKNEEDKVSCDFATERIGLWDYIRRGKISYWLSAPVIYGMIVPAVILDCCVTIYQAVCFPIYGIPKVRRSDYIVIDRHRLPYLNALQKLNCAYCGYFNGLIDYVREIASRTEEFWCPIRHSRRVRGVPTRYWHFMRYGDGKDLMKRWKKLREELKKEGEER